MPVRTTLLCLSLAAVAAPTAASRQSASVLPGRIMPGTGIAGIRVGMPADAALKLLRRTYGPARVERIRAGANGYVQYQYPTPYALYGIGVQRRAGTNRVVLVETYLAGNKTPAGIQVGSSARALLRTYGGLACRTRPRRDATIIVPDQRICVLGEQTRRNTVFVLSASPLSEAETSVVRIVVREPFVAVD